MNTKADNKNNKRKAAIALLAGLAITGIFGASAASLNGIDSTLGADVQNVLSCDADGVTVTYDASYNAATQKVEVDTATVGGVDADCDGLVYEVTLLDAAGAQLGQKAGTVVLDVDRFDVGFVPGVDAELVEKIAITISGPNS